MSRKVTLLTATSIDGFIARVDGKLDWVITEADAGCQEFYGQVDALFVGRGALERILSVGPWPYMGKPTYTFSRRTGARCPCPKGVTLVRRDPTRFVAQQKELPGGDLWILGGCGLNSALLRAGLIDQLVLMVYPAFFGTGIPLFDTRLGRRLHLTSSVTLPSGVLNLRYDVAK